MSDVSFGPTWPRARKKHRCSQCDRDIEPGETYRRQGYVSDGVAGSVIHCEQCAELSRLLSVAGFENDEGGWPWIPEIDQGDVAYCGLSVEMGHFRAQWRLADETLYIFPKPIAIEVASE